MPEKCCGLENSEDATRILQFDPVKVDLLCDARLANCTDGFYYHLERDTARCTDCQQAEWYAQGFEVEDGFPYGNWNASTEERLAERTRHELQTAARYQARGLGQDFETAWEALLAEETEENRRLVEIANQYDRQKRQKRSDANYVTI